MVSEKIKKKVSKKKKRSKEQLLSVTKLNYLSPIFLVVAAGFAET